MKIKKMRLKQSRRLKRLLRCLRLVQMSFHNCVRDGGGDDVDVRDVFHRVHRDVFRRVHLDHAELQRLQK